MPLKAGLNIKNEYDVLLVHNCERECQNGGKATQWTADPFNPGSIPGSGLKVFS